ncbi:low temperature-induced protein [Paenibacillus ferrarius]|uniref:Low temperature-induced protein n=1 Tax=Paenibacillus ferrarius TaxID=1469647 RepID=A0A1V4HQA3_9BACL|nr:general stress protein [Paenibacillus ferrarius]OPH60359.1 low temperature-induced protein [Paenibacillus ferrarius]
MSKHIIGVFHSETEAIQVINKLKNEGYSSDDISVIGRNNEGLSQIEDATETKAEEGLATGAASGGVLGGVTGLLASIGALAIPGIGPLIAAGPIVATLTGAAIGASAGGLVGSLIGLGIPEKEAATYEAYIKDGKILVLVESDAVRDPRVYETFRNHQSLNADTYSPEYGYRT